VGATLDKDVKMIRRSRLGLLVLALSAVALSLASAASASAANPQFEYPGVHEGGTDTFTITNSQTYVDANGGIYSCGKLSGTGTLTGPKTGVATLKIFECGLNNLPRNCHTGVKLNEMETVQLSITPVYAVYNGKKQVALLFKPTSGTAVAKLSCQWGGPAELKGSILGEWGGGGGKEHKLTFAGSISRRENQEPSVYENEKAEQVNAWLELGFTFGAPEWIREGWESIDTLVAAHEFSIAG
jgi:hypothetical protein